MRRWLPSFAICDVMHCSPDGEFEGRVLEIEWRDWIFQLGLLRRERQL